MTPDPAREGNLEDAVKAAGDPRRQVREYLAESTRDILADYRLLRWLRSRQEPELHRAMQYLDLAVQEHEDAAGAPRPGIAWQRSIWRWRHFREEAAGILRAFAGAGQ